MTSSYNGYYINGLIKVFVGSFCYQIVVSILSYKHLSLIISLLNSDGW